MSGAGVGGATQKLAVANLKHLVHQLTPGVVVHQQTVAPGAMRFNGATITGGALVGACQS